ncbi:MAG: transposase [Proteobacteria bacterium]|nr:transposase [Pseudomonadota bacterium]
MLLIKDSHKLFEFKEYFNSPTRAISHLIDILGVFSGRSIIKGVFANKSKGISLINLLQTLILMPFLGATNVNSLFKRHYQLFYKGKKDCLYDTLRDPNTDWRKLLLNFAKLFMKTINKNSSECRTSFFIVDDSDLEKRTPYFEGISRVFNHVTKSYPFAYKVLTLGYSDGKSFIPLDYSLHNEKSKKKNFGLTLKQRKEQYCKRRGESSNGAKRKKELRIKKGLNLIKMVKRAIKQGIVADYLLTDSWFLSENMINEIRKIKNGAIHILSMCRMDKRKYMTDKGEFNATMLRRQNKQLMKRSKKYRAAYIELLVEYKGIKLKLFFVRISKRSKWRLLVTTNTSLKFTQVYELYSNRWAIEVFFKECKQLLGLGKNQSRDFDAQIASTTICFIQYTILALYKRYNTYETIGGLFNTSKEAITEQIFSDRIKILFIELIEALVEVLNLTVELEDTISTIISHSDIESKISLVFSPHVDHGRKNKAA